MRQTKTKDKNFEEKREKETKRTISYYGNFFCSIIFNNQNYSTIKNDQL